MIYCIVKYCPGCQADKPFDEFSNHSKNRDGKQRLCKACDRERVKKQYQDTLAYSREKRKKWQEDNKELHNKHAQDYQHRRKKKD